MWHEEGSEYSSSTYCCKIFDPIEFFIIARLINSSSTLVEKKKIQGDGRKCFSGGQACIVKTKQNKKQILDRNRTLKKNPEPYK